VQAFFYQNNKDKRGRMASKLPSTLTAATTPGAQLRAAIAILDANAGSLPPVPMHTGAQKIYPSDLQGGDRASAGSAGSKPGAGSGRYFSINR
jgi:hypothetical protein